MSQEHITSGTIPVRSDTKRLLAVKDLGPKSGTHGANEEHYSSGKQPQRGSTERMLLVKDVNNEFN